MGNLNVLLKKGLLSLKSRGYKYTLLKVLKYIRNKRKFISYIKRNKLTKDDLGKQQSYVFENQYKFSILVPLYNTSLKFLCEMIESVINQTYSNWELCIVDGSDKNIKRIEEICTAYVRKDQRIRYSKLKDNYGISGNSNECVKMATGDYIVLLDHDDLLAPSALFENMMEIEKNSADFLYSDEIVFTNDMENPLLIHFKPDFAIDNLRSNNYICHLTVFKKSLIGDGKFFRQEYDGSQDYDIILRLTEKAEKIVHIRKALYFWRSHPGSVASDISVKSYCLDAAKKAIGSHLKRCGLQGEIIDSPAISTYKINYQIIGEPLISIIIPFQKDFKALSKCLHSLESSIYKNVEVNIIYSDNIENMVVGYFDNFNIKIKFIKFYGDYNYAKMCNYVSGEVDGEYILFLDEKQSLLSENAIEELLMYAQRIDVGAVGSILYNSDRKIYHAGIFFDGKTIVMNAYGVPENNLGYMGRLSYAQNISAVLVQGMMVRSAYFKLAGGFDVNLDEVMCGVDFSLKMLDAEHLNVFTPFSKFTLDKKIEKEYDKVPFDFGYTEKYCINREYWV